MKKKLMVLPIAALLLAGVASASVMVYQALAQDDPVPVEWPRVKMFYYSTGQFANINNTPVDMVIEYQLVYDGPDNWREDILRATPVTTRYGSFGRAGSYTQVKGNQYTEYDSIGGETTTETVPDGEKRLPQAMFYPIPFSDLEEGFGQSATQTDTTVRVCFNEECLDNAPAWKFVAGKRGRLYADDERGIPLTISGAKLTEVHIAGSQKAVVR